MTGTDQPRKPGGSPEGGQFAGKEHAEADVTLVPERDDVFHQRYDTLKEKVAAIHEEMTSAVENLDGDEEWMSYLRTISSFPRYSPNNQLLIALQTGGSASRVAGYKQWKKLGRQVNKGEKGIVILAPCKRTVNAKDKDGNKVVDDDGKEVKSTYVSGFTTASVFDISQTSGEDLPGSGRFEGRHGGEVPEGLQEDLEKEIERRGFSVSYAPLPGSKRGSTSPADHTVVIAEDADERERTAVLAHELGHIAAGHTERLDEYNTGDGGHRGAMEVEADSIAYALCKSNGFDVDPDASAGYVKGWSMCEHDPDVVKKSSHVVSKTVADILTTGKFRNVDTV